MCIGRLGIALLSQVGLETYDSYDCQRNSTRVGLRRSSRVYCTSMQCDHLSAGYEC